MDDVVRTRLPFTKHTIYETLFAARYGINPDTSDDFFQLLSFYVCNDRDTFFDVFMTTGLLADYVLGRSGSKYVSPMVTRYSITYPPTDEEYKPEFPYTLSDDALAKLAYAVATRFRIVWTKRVNTYKAEYNPLIDWNVISSGTTDSIGEYTMNHGHIVSSDGTISHGLATTTQATSSATGTATNTNESNSFAYGFNTADSSPVPQAKSTSTGTNQDTNSGTSSSTITNSGADETINTTINSGADSSDTSSNTKWIERHSGKRGNVTYQEILRQERELWKYEFLDSVFADIDSLIALKVY